METIQSQFTESEFKIRELSDTVEEREIQIVKLRNVMGSRVGELEAELEQVRKALGEELAFKEASRDGEKQKVFKDRIDSLKGQN